MAAPRFKASQKAAADVLARGKSSPVAKPLSRSNVDRALPKLVPSKPGGEINTGGSAPDRITFSAPSSENWPKRLQDEMHRRRDRSLSATIRALLELGLAK